MTRFDNMDVVENSNQEDTETLDKLEWELASQSGRITGSKNYKGSNDWNVFTQNKALWSLCSICCYIMQQTIDWHIVVEIKWLGQNLHWEQNIMIFMFNLLLHYVNATNNWLTMCSFRYFPAYTNRYDLKFGTEL